MRAAFAILAMLVALAAPQPAFAAIEDSRAWFEHLSPDDRSNTQGDLILLGHYRARADGAFGPVTFDAIKAFQLSQGRPDTGVLTPSERDSLGSLAAGVNGDWGMQLVRDEDGHSSMIIPTAFLTERMSTGDGTNFASSDGEFSLETMHADLAGTSFSELYAQLVEPQEDRTVTSRDYSDDRFVVTGTYGAYSFSTMFVRRAAEAVGYSLAWGDKYAAEGDIAALFLASHFAPLDDLSPSLDGATTAAVPEFVLPADRPDVIALNAEITGTTPDAFDAALKQRPDARIVVLNSPGGGVDSALFMARRIRDKGLSTYVPPGMGCYSACAYMFLAGAGRQADGELGVHQIYAEGSDLVLAQTTLGDVLDALQSYGVSQQVISHMLRTPPEDMYVFTRSELASLGISAGPPIHVAINLDVPAAAGDTSVPVGSLTTYVELATRTSADEAQRSLAYVEGRWSDLFDGARPEVATDVAEQGTLYRVRLAAPSIEHANSICTAIRSAGGGCYVSTE